MQEPLFFESAREALVHTVQTLGGFKVVGSRLRGDMAADSASDWLRKCLNADRAERLDPQQVEALVRIGRDAGCHAYMNYMASSLGYKPPEPLTAEAVQHETLVKGFQAMGQVHALIESLKKQGMDLSTLMNGVGK